MAPRVRPPWILLRPASGEEHRKLEVYPACPGVASAFPLHQEHVLKFTDPQLQKCYDSHLSKAAESSDELREVGALIAAHDMFRLLEGPHSPRVHEAIEHLLLPELRAALRNWYRRPDAETNPAVTEFRDHLTQLAGERFGPKTPDPHPQRTTEKMPL